MKNMFLNNVNTYPKWIYFYIYIIMDSFYIFIFKKTGLIYISTFKYACIYTDFFTFYSGIKLNVEKSYFIINFGFYVYGFF